MKNQFVYIQSEKGIYALWTVGHYNPEGKWIAESDHNNPEDAAKRVHYLNGGTTDRLPCGCQKGDSLCTHGNSSMR